MIHNFQEFINEHYMESDAVGYVVGKYIYHITTQQHLTEIKRHGFKPQNGTAINGKKFENRLYFATSLIAAYDLSVNFGSWKDTTDDYYIIKVRSECLTNEYKQDPLFVHGIYIDYPVSSSYIEDIIKANKLFNKFDEEDLENLY